MRSLIGLGLLAAGVAAYAQAPVERVGGSIDLPTSKQINGVVPGGPQRLGSLPVSIATSPDGKWVVTTNAGYGSYESGYAQSLSVLNVATGKLSETPDMRTVLETHQVLYSGLAFSPDGTKLYASIASETDPEGTKPGDTGSGIAVYGFADGVITPGPVMKIPMQALAGGRITELGNGRESKPSKLGIPYPASIAVVAGGAQLLVADNLSDDALLIDAASGAVLKRFDLSESDVVPNVYPVAVAVSKDGKRGFVALWNGSEVVELDLVKGTVARKLALLKNTNPVLPGSHPDALAMSPDGSDLYVALGNRDAVAAIAVGGSQFALKGYFDVRLPHQSFYGAQPESIAVNAAGTRLYVADMGADAVAVLDATKLTRKSASHGFVEPLGFIPTEWLPMGVAFTQGKLLIASGKATGTGPNNFPQRATEMTKANRRMKSPSTYIATLLHGSLASVDAAGAERGLTALTAETLEDNRMRAAEERIQWDPAVMARMESAKTNTGVLRSAQDDGVKRATAKADPLPLAQDDRVGSDQGAGQRRRFRGLFGM